MSYNNWTTLAHTREEWAKAGIPRFTTAHAWQLAGATPEDVMAAIGWGWDLKKFRRFMAVKRLMDQHSIPGDAVELFEIVEILRPTKHAEG